MEIFPEIGPRKIFWVPPNSAPGLRPWVLLSSCYVFMYDMCMYIIHSLRM